MHRTKPVWNTEKFDWPVSVRRSVSDYRHRSYHFYGHRRVSYMVLPEQYRFIKLRGKLKQTLNRTSVYWFNKWR